MITCADGHDVEQVESALLQAKGETERPSVVICETVKGKGISFMEGKSIWHGKAIGDAEYRQAKAELEGGKSHG